MALHPARLSHREDVENRPHPRVLVVDDDHQIRDLVCRFLTRYRYAVSPAENGREALAMFQKHPFDVVVTDLVMPVMDGLALMGRIRELAPGTPVLVITGQGPSAVESMGRIAAADAVLYKPFDLNHLATAIRELLSPSAAAAPIGKKASTLHEA